MKQEGAMACYEVQTLTRLLSDQLDGKHQCAHYLSLKLLHRLRLHSLGVYLFEPRNYWNSYSLANYTQVSCLHHLCSNSFKSPCCGDYLRLKVSLRSAGAAVRNPR